MSRATARGGATDGVGAADLAEVAPALDEIRWDDAGLVPVVVQDAADGRVLMVGYADREALEATRTTGELHLHSRSRGRLWRKGETSGNILRVRRLVADCDSDALLATVERTGPVCHRGTVSCFDDPGTARAGADAAAPGGAGAAAPGDGLDAGPADQGFDFLEELWRTIEERAAVRPAGSYVASLLAAGTDAVGRKVVEEATEVLIAAKDDAVAAREGLDRAGTEGALAGEAADLLFHVLVALAERGVEPTAVMAVLRERRGSR